MNELFYYVSGEKVFLKKIENIKFLSTPVNVHNVSLASEIKNEVSINFSNDVPDDCIVIKGGEDAFSKIRKKKNINGLRASYKDEWDNTIIHTDEILIQFRKGASEDDIKEIATKHDCIMGEPVDRYYRFKLENPDEEAPLFLANELSMLDEVQFAEPNALVKSKKQYMPTDSGFQKQWNLHNVQNQPVNRADIYALEAWNAAGTLGNPEIVVAVHDDGLDVNHPDLKSNLVPGWDFDYNQKTLYNVIDNHGTACAGIIAAAANGNGIVGVAPGCKIRPVKLVHSRRIETWYKSIIWAGKYSDVLSCSWSIPASNLITNAIKRVTHYGRRRKGTTCVFAAGNEEEKKLPFPAYLSEVIAVGATTNNLKRAKYSNIGRGLDLVAPSSGGTKGIITTDLMPPHGKKYISTFGGTSAAAPQVAGVIALMLSINSNLRVKDIKNILYSLADPVYNQTGWIPQTGHGKVNAERAILFMNSI